MTVKMECPSCHSNFTTKEDITLPEHGAVAVCLTCAVVAVWDNEHTTWLPAIGDHLRELLALPAVTETVMNVRLYHEQRDRDRETLRSLISHGFVTGMTITEVVEEILDEGFHRHPNEGDDT